MTRSTSDSISGVLRVVHPEEVPVEVLRDVACVAEAGVALVGPLAGLSRHSPAASALVERVLLACAGLMPPPAPPDMVRADLSPKAS